MASKLFNILNGINEGIEECKKNAKLAGFNVDEHTTIYSLANMFKEINNVENMRTKYTHTWKRPTGWLDTESILRNAPEKEGMEPRFIIMYDSSKTSITLDKYLPSTSSVGAKTLGVPIFYTSDGNWVDTTSALATYTWLNTDDEYHYVIGYSSAETIQRFYPTLSTDTLEVVFGKCEPKQIYISNAVSIRTIGDLINDTIEITSIQGTLLMKSIELPGVKKIIFSGTSSHSAYAIDVLTNAYSLVNFKADDLEEIEINARYNSTHKLFCISYLYLPKLKSIKYTYTGGYYSTLFGTSETNTNTRGLLFLDAPELETMFNFEMSLSGIYAPKLSSIGGSKMVLQLSGSTLATYLPSLKSAGDGTSTTTIAINNACDIYLPSLEICDTIQHYYQGNGYWMCGSVVLPKLHTAKTINFYPSNYSNNSRYQNKGMYIDAPSLKNIEYLSNSTGPISLDNINIPSIERITSGLQNIIDTDIVFPETLTNIPNNFLSSSSNVRRLVLPNNFVLSGLDLTNATLLSRNCLLDIANKLADVSSDTNNTYEITLGSTNLNKLTDAEKAIFTNKGWVLN